MVYCLRCDKVGYFSRMDAKDYAHYCSVHRDDVLRGD